MSNESLFILSALVNIVFIFCAARLGSKWLLGTVAVNLILVGIFGAKLITLFGFVTNAGNVFYACVFLATHFLLEQQGEGDRFKTIWFGVGFSLFFVFLSQCAAQSAGVLASDAVSSALAVVFSLSVRVVVASLIAYVFAQYVNITLYTWFRGRTKGTSLWIRSNVANILAQLVDSALFFTIAFPDLVGGLLIQAILVGWVIKIVAVFVGTPFLYLDRYLRHKK